MSGGRVEGVKEEACWKLNMKNQEHVDSRELTKNILILNNTLLFVH